MAGPCNTEFAQFGKGVDVAGGEVVEMPGEVEVIPVLAEEDRGRTAPIGKQEIDHASCANRASKASEKGERIRYVLQCVPAANHVEFLSGVLHLRRISNNYLEAPRPRYRCSFLRDLDSHAPPSRSAGLHERVTDPAPHVQERPAERSRRWKAGVVDARAVVSSWIGERELVSARTRRGDPQPADLAYSDLVSARNQLEPALGSTDYLSRRATTTRTVRRLEHERT